MSSDASLIAKSKRQNQSVIVFHAFRFIAYTFFAGLATIVDLLILVFLTEIIGIYYLYSSMISYIIGMITNYLLNKYKNFKNSNPQIAVQFSKFAIVAGIGLVLNSILLYLFVEKLGLYYIIAKLFGIGVVAIWSYFGHSTFTFAEKKMV